MANKEQVKKARQYMLDNKDSFGDGLGNLNYTRLAEATANEFNLSDRDDKIPEWVFDMAVDVDE